MSVERLDELGKEIIQEAVNRYTGKPNRLEEATGDYFDYFRQELSGVLVGHGTNDRYQSRWDETV